MSLTEAQQQRVEAWIQAKLRKMTCPLCGNDKWDLCDTLHAAPAVRKGANVDLGTWIGLFPLVCQNCAHVVFLSGQPLGLIE